MKKQVLIAVGFFFLFGVASTTIALGQATKKAPKGAINGLFTVSKNGDQVYFSQGNLQYIGSASKPYWKFADHQWDCIGRAQNGDAQNIDRDLFGFATSGFQHGGTCYQPWSTDYTPQNYYAYGDNYSLYHKDGTADWGANPISNGGNKGKMWKTLSVDEWAWVLKYRTTPSGILYAKAQVNGVNGIVILPDNWSRVTHILQNKNDAHASYSGNVISAEDWTKMEQNGAVFLPAAGRREWTAVAVLGIHGDYWTSDRLDKEHALGIHFEDSSFSFRGFMATRHHGCSARLVCPAK